MVGQRLHSARIPMRSFPRAASDLRKSKRCVQTGRYDMKLEGIRVIDLSQFLPGPHLTMLMADHGAEVIKIEPPGQGEPVRNLGYRAGGESVWFRNTHRGKKSAVLDLKTAEGREALLSLAQTADVVVEAFRPGVMKRLGIDYD